MVVTALERSNRVSSGYSGAVVLGLQRTRRSAAAGWVCGSGLGFGCCGKMPEELCKSRIPCTMNCPIRRIYIYTVYTYIFSLCTFIWCRDLNNANYG